MKKDSYSTACSKVFFMIGCQRSGSNWMRTMLSGREDLIAPHPPHIMRDFMPILDKYGDLDSIANLKVSKAKKKKNQIMIREYYARQR